MSAVFIPSSKGSLALVLVIGVIMGAVGVEQGHAGNAEIEKSDLDLPDRQELSSDDTVLPDVVADAYTNLVVNLLHGMTRFGMWMYSNGHALGQAVQWLPRTVVIAGVQCVSFGSMLALVGWRVLRARQFARDTR